MCLSGALSVIEEYVCNLTDSFIFRGSRFSIKIRGVIDFKRGKRNKKRKTLSLHCLSTTPPRVVAGPESLDLQVP